MAISSTAVMALGSTSAANKELVAYISANYHWQKVLAPIVTSKDIKRRDRNVNWVWNSSSRRAPRRAPAILHYLVPRLFLYVFFSYFLLPRAFMPCQFIRRF